FKEGGLTSFTEDGIFLEFHENRMPSPLVTSLDGNSSYSVHWNETGETKNQMTRDKTKKSPQKQTGKSQ
ncbi:MAG: hypothetical protein ACR2H1_06270, partial [Limisphaerales bacterium]